ncbi:MAG: hypothetical protein M3Y27_18525 [Acidobacteriota bacterium]|nr:hypothetical protein [Acidobacteriota bacterium]
MKLIRALIVLLLFGVWANAQKAEPKTSVFAEIEKMSADLEEITGLHFSKKVPAAIINKEQLRKFLDERIDVAIKPDDLRAEELTLKMLGLLPQDYDLRAGTVEMLTEQAAAFYDYKKKKLFILQGENNGGDGDTGGGQQIALVHELAHALADQNFHLDKYIQDKALNDDSATARMAVMEGQATWLMTAYMQKSLGGKPEVPEAVLDLMRRTVEMGATQYDVFSKAPLYVRESLLFPYTAGISFQDAVYRKFGQEAFREVFVRAPVSSQQILHPEKYLSKQESALPPAPSIEKRYRKLAEGTLGEFDFRVLLEPIAGKEQAAELAAHLKGSRYLLAEHKTERASSSTPVLSVISAWDSPDEARKFFDMYRQTIRKKSKTFVTATESETLLTGRADAGFFRVVLTGSSVESTEGLKTKPPE